MSLDTFSENAGFRIETVDGWTTVNLIHEDGRTFSFALSNRDMLALTVQIAVSIVASFLKEGDSE